MTFTPRVVAHEALTCADLAALRTLFDREYLDEHGPWDPDHPYGYAPASMHAIVHDAAGTVVAHVGFQPREIAVGESSVLVAGTGGVLVDARFRGRGLGELAMSTAQGAMRANPALEFGYLGCREEVVPFYERTGWRRIHVAERSVSRTPATSGVPVTSGTPETSGTPTTIGTPETILEEGAPVLIFPLRRDVRAWPPGPVDLRGRPW
ncbi:aminoglycoside 2'-N-acetyltransferase I [Pseudoclavibacter sp. JAI123]|uniref:GNAT family N-acetyltransferase n=1 Tax=Pseudoclavibacter sp. JAI123 TaxID=2723065 RepID=UPI0015CEF2F6|nr:GNAT family N-acetyltransferase [Pseudoclavibacter sp. JAI123]NYF14361.1 aminoglycoside 2'-N-acetyltransferase I [Pseudoclavibacter sp. JAI123]